jgi:phosphosulfolactate synthase
MRPAQWAAAVSNDLEAGATWVLAEGRASGTVGLYHPSGAVREDIVAALTAEVDAGLIVFEAPREGQQAWFVAAFGSDVNLANVAPADALGLETLRLSLRADTFEATAPGPVPARGT